MRNKRKKFNLKRGDIFKLNSFNGLFAFENNAWDILISVQEKSSKKL